MTDGPTLLDTDTLSQLSRGHPKVDEHARGELLRHGHLTMAAVSVFERLRGYRSAIAKGKPYELHLQRFVALAKRSRVLPVDTEVADHAARIWAAAAARQRGAILDLLIVATASAHGLPVATRNVADLGPLAVLAPTPVRLVDWAL